MALALIIPFAIVIGAVYAAAESWWYRRHPRPVPQPAVPRTAVVVRAAYPDRYEALHIEEARTGPPAP